MDERVPASQDANQLMLWEPLWLALLRACGTAIIVAPFSWFAGGWIGQSKFISARDAAVGLFIGVMSQLVSRRAIIVDPKGVSMIDASFTAFWQRSARRKLIACVSAVWQVNQERKWYGNVLEFELHRRTRQYRFPIASQQSTVADAVTRILQSAEWSN